MAVIELRTHIHAPIAICFDAARDIDLHQASTSDTRERAIAGRTSGVCEAGDRITWEAIHFGMRQQLTVEITAMEAPFHFEDRQVKGRFRSMVHKHSFEETNGVTMMSDHFAYETPFWPLGVLFDTLVLKRYMTRFLEKRNAVLKQIAEERARAQ
ncbi:MAG: SRPBCC family protein [Flavobacteriales bacterium]|nr:SRPBCC family protein [Flavobacteriales bacterium]MBK9286380.1 SRPBCC family protein [Flavobacteriales bacterium]MBL0034752.1 SRPBCC family protein [Flavobacteriales bacterium]